MSCSQPSSLRNLLTDVRLLEIPTYVVCEAWRDIALILAQLARSRP